jgi:hypothetical protein
VNVFVLYKALLMFGDNFFPFVFLGGSCGWDEGVGTFFSSIQIVLLM